MKKRDHTNSNVQPHGKYNRHIMSGLHLGIYRIVIGCLLFLLLPTQMLNAQRVGEWQVHSSCSNFDRMVRFEEHLYLLSDNNVFTCDTTDFRFTPFTRLSGLSDAGIQFLEVSEELGILAFVYGDGNIDLMNRDGEIHNIPDLKNKTIIGDKTLYACHSDGKRLYISAGFGFIIVDMTRGEISDSFNFGESCDAAFIFGKHYYMSVASGLWHCPTSSNAYDRANWLLISPERIKDVSLFSHRETLHCWFTTLNNQLFRLLTDGEMKQQFPHRNHFTSIAHVGDYLFMHGYGYMTLDIDLGTLSFGFDEPMLNAVDVAEKDSATFFLLHKSEGIYQLRLNALPQEDATSYEILGDNVLPQGIGTTALYNLSFTDGVLVGISGAKPQPIPYQSGILATYSDGSWYNLTETDYNDQLLPMPYPRKPDLPIAQLPPPSPSYFRGLSTLAPDPLHPGRYYIGSFRYGFFYVEGDSVIAHYNGNNSNIDYLLDDFVADYVSAIYPDENGYVWFTNGTVSPNLKCKTPSGKWLSFPISGFDGSHTIPKLFQAKNDPYRFKWVLCTFSSSKCAMYYDAGTPEDRSDDDCISFASLIDQDGNVITPNYFNYIAEDREGKIWLLTTSGPFVIESPIATFKTPGQVRRLKIPRNDGTNLADYLLADVNTTCIAIDAANQKWIGTQGDGVYLISADGLQTIRHFTSSNSPLMTNDILSIAIDHNTGMVYFSTEGGICSFVSDAIEGKNDLSNVLCWPNPVRPEYSGDLHISGLMDNTMVRITDVQNNVLYATTSVGGMASWNLCNNSGSRVKSGVYLIYGYNEEGEEGVVAKVLVIK